MKLVIIACLKWPAVFTSNPKSLKEHLAASSGEIAVGSLLGFNFVKTEAGSIT